MNKLIKRIGGAFGIFDSPISLMKWMISGPEIAGMLSEFEKSNQIKSNQIKSNQIKSNQIKSNQIKSNQINRYLFLKKV